ncbi:hypothetical protein VU04_05445 [Desulfobulbus sp. TB]|nr:hypothetical protein [Desulfobulbus sp. TB]
MKKEDLHLLEYRQVLLVGFKQNYLPYYTKKQGEYGMSRQLIEFSLENGKSVFVEEQCSDDVRRGETEASRMGDFVKDKITMPFKEAMEATREATEVIIQQIDSLKKSSNCPEEINVEFGIKLGSKIEVPIITSLDGDVNLKVTLKWMK